MAIEHATKVHNDKRERIQVVLAKGDFIHKDLIKALPDIRLSITEINNIFNVLFPTATDDDFNSTSSRIVGETVLSNYKNNIFTGGSIPTLINKEGFDGSLQSLEIQKKEYTIWECDGVEVDVKNTDFVSTDDSNVMIGGNTSDTDNNDDCDQYKNNDGGVDKDIKEEDRRGDEEDDDDDDDVEWEDEMYNANQYSVLSSKTKSDVLGHGLSNAYEMSTPYTLVS